MKFLALGDSFTEGVGDEDPLRPNLVRGWADRVAEVLCAGADWQYANLAIRGKKIGQVINQQLNRGLSLSPDLVSIYAGGNDILRPKVDIDSVMTGYAGMVRRFTDSGARVLVFTGFDTADSALFSKTRPRTARYNELVRSIAHEQGAMVADYWRWREFSDGRYWATDRLHMNAAGHTLMARRVLEVLGDHEVIPPQWADHIATPTLAPLANRKRSERMREDLRWTRQYLAPWVKRRLTGTSSGDLLQPKYPDYVRLT